MPSDPKHPQIRYFGPKYSYSTELELMEDEYPELLGKYLRLMEATKSDLPLCNKCDLQKVPRADRKVCSPCTGRDFLDRLYWAEPINRHVRFEYQIPAEAIKALPTVMGIFETCAKLQFLHSPHPIFTTALSYPGVICRMVEIEANRWFQRLEATLDQEKGVLTTNLQPATLGFSVKMRRILDLPRGKHKLLIEE